MLGGQVIDPVGKTAQVVLAGESIEQAGAEQRRVGVVDQAPGEATVRHVVAGIVAVGPGDVLGQPGRPAAARDELAEPDRRLLALAAQADQLDLDFEAGEMLGEVAGRAELDRPGGDSPR